MINFCKDFIKAQTKYQVPRGSSSLAYYLMFSFFPLLIFLHSILGLLNLSIVDIENYLYFLPENVLSIIVDYNSYLVQSDNIVSLIVGLGLMLYSFTRCINSLYITINQIYDSPKPKRSFIKSGFFTISFMISVYLMFFLTVVGDFLLNYLSRYFEFLIEFFAILQFTRYLIGSIYIFVVILLIYKLVPNIKLTVFQCLPGTVFAIVGIFISSLLFSIYVVYFSNYSLIYGSLSTVMLLILWLYLCSVVIIEGCIINKLIFDRRCKNEEDLK